VRAGTVRRKTLFVWRGIGSQSAVQLWEVTDLFAASICSHCVDPRQSTI
jgi:hypothetical protein